MSYAAKLRKVGGSVMLAIPKPMLHALELTADGAVGLTIQSGRLIVEPKAQRRYSLNELLAQHKSAPKQKRKDNAWLAGGPAGRELI
jgi:antitoxin ChpS